MCIVYEHLETDVVSVGEHICVFVGGRECILESILKAAASGLSAYVSLYCKTQQNKNKLAARDKGPALSAAQSDLCVFLSVCTRRQNERKRY